MIETGSNQDLIFKTNKQRLNVAASRLIWSVGFEWIPEAIAEVVASGERVDHVVKASGLAVFIASPEAGRHVIEKVTTRAIHEAPELDIWGVVGSDDIADESGELAQTGLGRALGRAQRSSAGWRQRRPSPAMRDPNFPHTQVCAFTGRPAVGHVHEAGDRFPVSAGTKELWEGSKEARGQLVDRLKEAIPDDRDADRKALDSAVVSVEDLEAGDGVANNGWVAVLHADGNGIGEIFANLRRVYDGDCLVEKLRSVSETLERCAWQAVAEAIVETPQKMASRSGEDGLRLPDGWILPVLVGGDDITVVVHAGFALEFARALTRRFEALLNAEELIKTVLERIREHQEGWPGGVVSAPERLSLASGLAFVKPHHPFSHAINLVDELIVSAKSLKAHEVSALDVHVLHESAVRSLDDIREPLEASIDGTKRRLWAGPIVLSEDAVLSEKALSEIGARSVEHLDTVMGFVSGVGEDRVPSAVLHRLRAALTAAPEAGARLESALERARSVASGCPYESNLRKLLDNHLQVADHPSEFCRLLTAMELTDVASGTAAARDRGEPQQSEVG